jgi:hypothetical protein
MAGRVLYTNQAHSALSFFSEHADRCTEARLACPFFTWTEPLKILKQAGVNDIQLLVRLCYATLPESLKETLSIPGLSIRYFASDTFHAKLYILKDIAFLGSANLTIRGLKVNHEVGITLHETDPLFAELNDYFVFLWGQASELTSSAFTRFIEWHESCAGTMPDEYSESLELNQSEAEVTGGEDKKRTIPPRMFTHFCVDQLRRFGEPKSTKDIYLALLRRGYDIIPSQTPSSSRKRRPVFRMVYNALFNCQDTGVVFRSGKNLWHLAEWHTAEESDRLKQEHKKADSEHIARTRRGIEDARLRGTQIGAVRKMTSEDIERAAQMRRDGATRIEIAKKFGVAQATIDNNFRAEGIAFPKRGRRSNKMGNLPPGPGSDLVEDRIDAANEQAKQDRPRTDISTD